MADIKIEVTAYSGYRGEESPRSFIVDGRKVDVLVVERMWMAEEELSRRQRRFFSVKGSDGVLYTLYYDLEYREWFLRSGGRDDVK